MHKLNKIKEEMIFTALFLYLLLFAAFNFNVETGNKVYDVKYNGLVWVGLDRWTIQKYNSLDKPMKWIEVNVYTTNNNDHGTEI